MSMDELLLKLKKEYLAEMPEKISELNKLYQEKNISELRNAFHKLKGSGKTYGVAPASLVGKSMEMICSEQPDLLSDELFQQAITLLEAIGKNEIVSEEETLKDPRFKALQAA